MNPYDFVRLDWARAPVRSRFVPHDRFSGLSGGIECTLVAETPIFLPHAIEESPRRFMVDGRERPYIPGSSLKGLLRSLTETIGPGCWWLFDGDYRKDDIHYKQLLPAAYVRCTDSNRLCPACRMFGLVSGGQNGAVLLGKVSVEDAVCVTQIKHRAVFTPILDNPKPRHDAWYLSPDGQTLAGRKYYFHQAQIQTMDTQRATRGGVVLNAQITPLDAGSTFGFRVHFDNASEEELNMLIYALVLEPAMRHKIGYAKPAGFGSVRITVDRLTSGDATARYKGVAPQSLAGVELDASIRARVAKVAAAVAPVTLADLRRIWHWPAIGTHSYPGRPWFNDNPDAPISETP